MNVTETWQCGKCNREYACSENAISCFNGHREHQVTHWYKCGKCKEGYFIKERAEDCCEMTAQREWATKYGAKVYGHPTYSKGSLGTRWQCIWRQGGSLHVMDSYASQADAIARAKQHSERIKLDFGTE